MASLENSHRSRHPRALSFNRSLTEAGLHMLQLQMPMRKTHTIDQVPKQQHEQVAQIPLLSREPVLSPVSPLDRLQQAACGLSEVQPQDVTAILTDVVITEVAAVKKMAAQVDDMNQMLFSQGSNAGASPSAILMILERMSALYCQRQAEFLKSAELLHRLASPPIRPTVNVLSVTRA